MFIDVSNADSTLKAGKRQLLCRDQLLMMQIELLNVVFMMNTISIKEHSRADLTGKSSYVVACRIRCLLVRIWPTLPIRYLDIIERRYDAI